uniref:Uncharacterized protein n=1 Tax=Arundo donax TaxID=35708 RepID=A0A0A9HLV6_ARUDO
MPSFRRAVIFDIFPIRGNSKISGDPVVESFEGTHLVFVGARSNPFEVITNSVKAVERHLQTFSHREKKKCQTC